jgi:5-amino-6-(5-phosphoribosylamino)uracil reductase
VQTLDGVVSLLGANGSGADISQSPEDRWLMDLLRAHADAILLGMGTLRLETSLERPSPRGPVFRIVDPALQDLRRKLHRGRERNIFLSASSDIDFGRYAAFDGEKVDSFLLTTAPAAAVLAPRLRKHPQIQVIACGEGPLVNLEQAMRLLRREFDIRYLLCEGGPTMYSYMLADDLIDEKFLTVSPFEVGLRVPEDDPKCELPLGLPLRLTAFAFGGVTKEKAIPWEWLSCRKVGDHQFHRLRRKRS